MSSGWALEPSQSPPQTIDLGIAPPQPQGCVTPTGHSTSLFYPREEMNQIARIQRMWLATLVG